MTTEPLSPLSDTSQNAAHILDAARTAIDAEMRLAERLEEKARGQATLAGSWFAVAQAIAVVSLTSHTAQSWVVALVVLLALQAASLCMLLRAASQVWRLQTEDDVGVPSLRAMQEDLALSAPEFAAQAIDFYCRILASARTANAKRADAFGADQGCTHYLSATFWWRPVLAFGLAEMIVALLSRVS